MLKLHALFERHYPVGARAHGVDRPAWPLYSRAAVLLTSCTLSALSRNLQLVHKHLTRHVVNKYSLVFEWKGSEAASQKPWLACVTAGISGMPAVALLCRSIQRSAHPAGPRAICCFSRYLCSYAHMDVVPVVDPAAWTHE